MIDPIANERVTAEEITSYAQARGYDLQSLRSDTTFQKGHRWIFLWRKRAELPCTGRPEEKDGTLHYNLQGTVSRHAYLPADASFADWSEAGTLESVQEAFELVKDWLLEGKEVDDLPHREVRRGLLLREGGVGAKSVTREEIG
jgi:hypothetical protein